MWLAKKGDWDSLISGYLEPPHPDDAATHAGSIMLDKILNELEQIRFKSELLDSEVLGDSKHSLLLNDLNF